MTVHRQRSRYDTHASATAWWTIGVLVLIAAMAVTVAMVMEPM